MLRVLPPTMQKQILQLYLFRDRLEHVETDDVARFTIHVPACPATNKVARFVFVGGKTRNIAIQFAFQQCCKTSCTFFVARFTVCRLT